MDAARLARLLEAARLALPDGARVEVAGEDPVLQSRFHAGEAAAVALALAASASARLGELRGLPPQRVRVSARAAAATLLGFVFQRAEKGPDLARSE